jgi:hypothetical protein
LDASSLFLGVLFGAFGFAYFVYGKKQGAMIPLLSGMALMVFPYFVANDWLLFLIGLALIAAPWCFRQ